MSTDRGSSEPYLWDIPKTEVQGKEESKKKTEM